MVKKRYHETFRRQRGAFIHTVIGQLHFTGNLRIGIFAFSYPDSECLIEMNGCVK